MIVSDHTCTIQLGTFTCTQAEFVDSEGNLFRWFLNDSVVGGVLQYEIHFAGPKTHVLRYSLIDFGEKGSHAP